MVIEMCVHIFLRHPYSGLYEWRHCRVANDNSVSVIITSIQFRVSEFVFVRQETEALVRVYQKLVATNVGVMARQAAGSGQGTVLTSAGVTPGVCEVRRKKNISCVSPECKHVNCASDQQY
jgi:hypothetical protein